VIRGHSCTQVELLTKLSPENVDDGLGVMVSLLPYCTLL